MKLLIYSLWLSLLLPGTRAWAQPDSLRATRPDSQGAENPSPQPGPKLRNLWWLTLGMGAASQVELDRALSPLRYSGWGPAAQVGFRTEGKRGGTLGLLISAAYNPLSIQSKEVWLYTHATQYRLNTDLFYLSTVWSRQAGARFFRIKAGGSWNVLAVGRYASAYLNSGFSYDALTSLGPAATAEFALPLSNAPLGRTLRLRLQAEVPFIALGARPPYLNDYFGTGTNSNVMDNLHFASLHDYRRFRFTAELLYPARKSRNVIGIAYRYDRYTFKPGWAPVYSALHELIFNLYFGL